MAVAKRHGISEIGRRLHQHAEMFDRIIGELIEDTPVVGEIDRHLCERLAPAVKPVGLKRDRRGGGSIRDVCLMGLDHGPHNTSLFQLSLAGY